MKFYVVIIGLVLLLGNSLYAFSAIIIEPVLTLSETYNDNIYLESENTDSDWITTVAPGIGLYYDSKELKIDLDYTLLFQYYRDHSEENETSLRDIQRALADVLVFAERDFTLALREEISRVVIDDREQSVAENELVNKTTLYHFTANPQYQWRALPTFSAVLEYRYDDYDYVAVEGDDVEKHLYGLSLVKELATETKIIIKGFQVDYRTETEEDYRLQQVSGGLAQQVGPMWLIDAEGGFAQVDFDTGLQVEDSIWVANVTGRIAKNFKLILATDRAFLVSVNAGLVKRTWASVTLRYQDVFAAELETDIEERIGIKLRTDTDQETDIEEESDVEPKTYLELKTYWLEDIYQTEYRIDRSFGGLLKGGVHLSRKFILSGEGDIGQYEFLPVDEKALRFGVGTSLEYVGRRGSLSLSYTFRNNNSDIETNDFTNHIATLTFSMGL